MAEPVSDPKLAEAVEKALERHFEWNNQGSASGMCECSLDWPCSDLATFRTLLESWRQRGEELANAREGIILYEVDVERLKAELAELKKSVS